MKDLETKVSEAIKHFWITREKQRQKQGAKTGAKDAGSRGAVTGGKQMDGFVELIRRALIDGGLPDAEMIFTQARQRALPGYFRPTKDWDLIVIAQKQLLAVVEFKSQVGSFGNNLNNRTEEALGNATDLWAAFREGAFKPSLRPWLGWFMLLQEAPASTRVVRVAEPHFPVFLEFKNTTYADRYKILCEKLVRERLYDAACFIMSDKEGGLEGNYREPSPELSIRTFLASLTGTACARANLLHEGKGAILAGGGEEG